MLLHGDDAISYHQVFPSATGAKPVTLHVTCTVSFDGMEGPCVPPASE